jgi:acyl-CoA synthetase (NDP forming)
MTPPPSRLARLLRPRSIAFIGGREAEVALRKTLELGFPGEVFPVNPKRHTMAGRSCFPSVEALPEAPDVAFLAVPREATIEVVRALAQAGAGSVVCYASGFAEAGGEGIALEADLLAAARGMPLLGPNCYGFLNYLERCAAWPDEHGGAPREGGVAILTQSGNMGLNFTMARRALPLAGLYTLGNQADVDLAALLEALAEDPRIGAIGLHVEGVKDVAGFAAAARRALELRKPVVALKTGRSAAGARVALSHTSALAGKDTLYDALFARFGIARATSVSGFLETLKLLHLGGPLPGRRIASMSCSGGEAALIADVAEGRDLLFPPFDEAGRRRVRAALDERVTIDNPLDYHTFIWNDEPRQEACFAAVLAGGFDAVVLILDVPPIENVDASSWHTAVRAFRTAVARSGIRAAVLASLADCMPAALAEELAAAGIAPLVGFEDALAALEAAARIGAAWARPLPLAWRPLGAAAAPEEEIETLSEVDSKRRLAAAGIAIPDHALASAQTAADQGQRIGYPLVVKASSKDLAHKSEVGGIALDLRSRKEVVRACNRMSRLTDRFLIERLVHDAVAEVILGVVHDAQFGLCLVVGAGGVLTELVEDSASLLLPAPREEIEAALRGCKVWRLVEGFRGKSGDGAALIDAAVAVAGFAEANADTLVELDVNPLLVRPPGRGVVAADALIRLRKEREP